MTKREQMRIKSYFAKSVDQAMAQAREELGPEAMLLNTRKAPADQLDGGGYEVIFGLAEESPAAVSSVPPIIALPAAELIGHMSEANDRPGASGPERVKPGGLHLDRQNALAAAKRDGVGGFAERRVGGPGRTAMHPVPGAPDKLTFAFEPVPGEDA